MNWKLIILLSLLGVVSAVLSVYLLAPTAEFFVWIGVTLASALLIGRYAARRWFLHGFVLAMVNAFWVTVTQVALFHTYVATHPEYLRMTETLPDVLAAHPRRLVLYRAPIIAVLSGMVTGLFAWIAGRSMDRLR